MGSPFMSIAGVKLSLPVMYGQYTSGQAARVLALMKIREFDPELADHLEEFEVWDAEAAWQAYRSKYPAVAPAALQQPQQQQRQPRQQQQQQQRQQQTPEMMEGVASAKASVNQVTGGDEFRTYAGVAEPLWHQLYYSLAGPLIEAEVEGRSHAAASSWLQRFPILPVECLRGGLGSVLLIGRVLPGSVLRQTVRDICATPHTRCTVVLPTKWRDAAKFLVRHQLQQLLLPGWP
jgi:hypothetical protein